MFQKIVSFLIKICLSLVLFLSFFIAFTFTTSNETGPLYSLIDQHHPFVSWKPLYIKTTTEESPIELTSTFQYREVAFDQNGTPQDISFSTSEKIKANTYLKLTAKGRYVESYQKITKSAVPKKALRQLNS